MPCLESQRAWETAANLLAVVVLVGCGARTRVLIDDEEASPGASNADADIQDADLEDGDAQVDDAAAPEVGPPREVEWVELGLVSSWAPPPPRLSHFAVYDSRDRSMIVLGGYDPYGDLGGCCIDPYTYYTDVWRFDVGQERWEHIADLTEPVMNLTGSTAALDLPRNRIVLVGAVDELNFGTAENFEINMDTWELGRLPEGPWPSRDWPLSTAHDPARHQIVAHDAFNHERVEGTWILDLESDRWTTLETSASPPHRFHTAMVSRPGESLLLHAGYFGDDYTGDLWDLDPDSGTWTAIDLDLPLPERSNHAMLWEPLRRLLVVFGGYVGSSPVDLGLIDIDQRTFTTPDLEPRPSERREHTVVLDQQDRRLLLFGGAIDSSRALNDTWALVLP